METAWEALPASRGEKWRKYGCPVIYNTNTIRFYGKMYTETSTLNLKQIPFCPQTDHVKWTFGLQKGLFFCVKKRSNLSMIGLYPSIYSPVFDWRFDVSRTFADACIMRWFQTTTDEILFQILSSNHCKLE